MKNQTRVSSEHQLREGPLPGASPGVLTRIDELVDRYSGCLEADGDLRERTEGLRGE